MRLILLLCLLAAAPALSQPRARMVVVDAVRVETLRDVQPAQARLVAGRRAAVAAQISGVVEAVEARVGDMVDKGAPLARLAEAAPRLALEAAEAALAEAEAQRSASEADAALADQGLARVEKLSGSSAFSGAALQDRRAEAARARGRLIAAEAAIASARAKRDRAAFDLSNAVIRAPFPGVVVERFAQPGAYLSAGEPVAALLDPASLELEVPIRAELADSLAPGFEVSARIGGAIIPAILRAVVPEEDSATRARPARFTLKTSPAHLAAGQTAQVELPSGSPRDALTVAKDAVTQGPEGPMVFIVMDGVAQARLVELGASSGDRLEVRAGLSEGDLAVVRGNERLEPGEAVEVAPTASPAGN